MTTPTTLSPADKPSVLLSELLLSPRADGALHASAEAQLGSMSRDEFDAMVTLAGSNHVVIRALEVLLERLQARKDERRAAWTAAALFYERRRIAKAVEYLSTICGAFGEEGLDVTVIKSLDHWPDLGSDIDLYTNAQPQAVIELFHRRFKATVLARSWGDRLACKWNFSIPGLPESIEAHVGRLGQTGELVAFARQIPTRARTVEIAGQMFPVPCPEDRVLISTLQRMYRHFYFRLSDIVNSANLVQSGALDFDKLRATAEAAGIWPGTAAYLMIVSDYVTQFSGSPLPLPANVIQAAAFGGGLTYFNRGFLRVPIVPQSVRLYRTQMSELLRKREFHSSARLGLLPWLATAAVMGQKLTGSDKGIW